LARGSLNQKMRLLPCAIVAVACLLAALPSQAQSPDGPAQWTLPSGGLLNGSKAEIESGPCCGASRGSVRNPDAAAIAKVPGLASRDGMTLRLQLAGSRALKVTDCDFADCPDDPHTHRLVGWWPNHHLYVVAVMLSEEGVAWLVSQADGRTLMVAAPPVLSPSGRLAVALVSNLMAGVDLQVIDFGQTPTAIITVTTMPGCPGSSESSMLRPKPVWIDDSRIKFEGKSPQPGDNPNVRQQLKIVDGKPTWEC
jgi:hypothetical protein